MSVLVHVCAKQCVELDAAPKSIHNEKSGWKPLGPIYPIFREVSFLPCQKAWSDVVCTV